MATDLVQFAQDLKRKIPIDEIVREYVPELRRAGSSLKCRCPFHDEKTPSFNVNPEFGVYHCFGCGAGGDGIKFVQEIEKVDFRLAVETLARRFRIPVPVFDAPGLAPEERDERARRRDAILAMHAFAERWFAERLRDDPVAEAARDYLIGRGLTPDQMREYRLGYAPRERDALLRRLSREGYAADLVVEGGLASRTEDGRIVDRFRDRIMFPIADLHGRVVAFGGRIMEGDAAKYLNSAETPIFRKGSLLYGLAAARDAIRDAGSAVLLEGYMDWIALHGSGVRNVVAGLGTAFGEDQAKLLKRIAPEVVLHYDGDAAGRKAMLRAAELLLAQEVRVKVAALPEPHDPDTYIRENGPGATRELLGAALGAIDFFTGAALREFPAAAPEGKAAIVDRLAPLLLAIKDDILREGYEKQVADRLGLDLETLRRGLRKRTRAERRPFRQDERPGGAGADLPPGFSAGEDDEGADPFGEAPPRVYVAAGRRRRELLLLRLAIQRFHTKEFPRENDAELLADPVVREIYKRTRQWARDLVEGSDPPRDWFELTETEFERRALAEALCLESRLAEGDLPLPRLDRPDVVALVLEDLRHCLRRENSRRERRERRAMATGAGHGANAELKAEIHRIGAEAVREHESRYADGVSD